MRRLLLITTLSLALLPGSCSQVQAQPGEKTLFVGVPLGAGVGAYNGLGFVAGVNTWFQYPLAPKAALVGRLGGDVFLVKGRYTEYYRKNYQTTVGYSVPVTVGPRFYILDGLHAGLNLGADIGVNSLALTSFHFEPVWGYVFRLPNGRYADVSTNLTTSFNRGSGSYSFTFAYGLPVGR